MGHLTLVAGSSLNSVSHGLLPQKRHPDLIICSTLPLCFFFFFSLLREIRVALLSWAVKAAAAAAAARAALPIPISACSFFLWCLKQPYGCQFEFGIFNVRTDVDACDCTHGGGTDTVCRRCLHLKLTLGEESFAVPWTRTRVSTALRLFGRTLYPLSCSRPLDD